MKMYYCKWTKEDVDLGNMVVFYTEIDSDGNVRREIGLNEEGKVVHKCPSNLYPYGTYGFFDNQKVVITDTRSFITKEEFEELFQGSEIHMTIREIVNKKKKKLVTISLLGFVIFLLGIFLGARNKTISWFGLVGFLVFFFSTVASYFIFRCTKCNGNLGYLIMTSGHMFTISEKIHFCPYCGVNIDDNQFQ